MVLNNSDAPVSPQLGLAFGDEFEQALPPAPPKAPRARRKPAATTPAAAVPTAPPAVASVAPVALALQISSAAAGAVAAPPVAAESVPVVSSGLSPEGMAQALDAHPDYRVLRRLVPTLDFGPAPDGADLAQVLVLDTETTGLDSARDSVIELALLRVAVDRRTGQPFGPVQVYDGLEDPGRPLPAEIVKITGITDALLAGQRLDEARVTELLHGVDLVVAHNAGFDRPFVEARCPHFAARAWACSWADLDWKALGQGSAKLESLALGLGLFYDAHRAETDCHALLAVLNQPASAFGEGVSTPSEAPAPTLLAELLQAARQPQHRLQATGAPFEAKDALKARGYRWDGNQRVWGTVLRTEAALRAELRWLADAVYGGRAVRVRVETLDAHHRYSPRPGELSMRAVGGNDGLDDGSTEAPSREAGA